MNMYINSSNYQNANIHSISSHTDNPRKNFKNRVRFFKFISTRAPFFPEWLEYIDIVQTSNNVRCRYDIGSCIKHGSRDDAHLINRIQWSESSVTSMASSEERGDLLVLRIDLYYEHVCLMILNGYELQSLVIIIHSYIDAVLPS